MEKTAQNRGFTLIELVIGIAIFGILVAVGLPSFTSAIQNSRISSQYNNTIGAFFIARSEAVKTSGNVTVCARLEDQSQGCKQGGGDWSHGIIVFVDDLPVVDDTTIVIGSEDTVIHVEPKLTGDNTLMAYGATDNTAATSEARSYVTYNPNGSTNWRGASLILCDSRYEEYARAMNIVITGDIRRGRKPNVTSAPLDTFGVPAVCP